MNLKPEPGEMVYQVEVPVSLHQVENYGAGGDELLGYILKRARQDAGATLAESIFYGRWYRIRFEEIWPTELERDQARRPYRYSGEQDAGPFDRLTYLIRIRVLELKEERHDLSFIIPEKQLRTPLRQRIKRAWRILRGRSLF